MKIGFYAPALRMMSLPEIAKWAGQNGFQALELWTTDDPKAGLYSESMLNLAGFDKAKAKELQNMMAESGLEISCISYNQNMLRPDGREARFDRLRKVVDAASLLDVNTVSIFAGRDYDQSLDDNVKLFGEVFAQPLRYAQERGVRLAIENCPVFWERRGLIGNMAFSPFYWSKLFDAVAPLENLGLNYDPSHLYWQQIDIDLSIKESASRIFHVHAKDAEVDETRLAREGNLTFWTMVWRYRVPGMGKLNWPRIISLLFENGYDGTLSIEHEDMVWGRDTAEKVQRGLIIGRKCLEVLIG